MLGAIKPHPAFSLSPIQAGSQEIPGAAHLIAGDSNHTAPSNSFLDPTPTTIRPQASLLSLLPQVILEKLGRLPCSPRSLITGVTHWSCPRCLRSSSPVGGGVTLFLQRGHSLLTLEGQDQGVSKLSAYWHLRFSDRAQPPPPHPPQLLSLAPATPPHCSPRDGPARKALVERRGGGQLPQTQDRCQAVWGSLSCDGPSVFTGMRQLEAHHGAQQL